MTEENSNPSPSGRLLRPALAGRQAWTAVWIAAGVARGMKGDEEMVQFIDIPVDESLMSSWAKDNKDNIVTINTRSIAEIRNGYILIDNAHAIYTPLSRVEIVALIKSPPTLPGSEGDDDKSKTL